MNLVIDKALVSLSVGNRKLHSTETPLLHVTDELLKAMDDKLVSIVVLLDMSKAISFCRNYNHLESRHPV